MALFFDRAKISGNARITPEGYFVADALVARANNVQDYRASELGLTDRKPDDVVRVFRPESEVFAPDSVATAVRLPVTLDHPVKDGKPVLVDATNWREFTRGETGDEVLRDGEFMRVPLRVTDASAVTSVQRDRQEFSLGYNAELRLEPGQFGDQAYDAIMSNIRYNHLAACRTARGGAELRIVDERPPNTGAKAMNVLMVDGFAVNLEDATATKAALEKVVAERDAAVQDCKAAQQTVATRDATIAERDSTIVELKDAAEKAKVTPAQLRDAARSYGVTLANAKALGATITDEMDEPAVRAAAVAARLGDTAKAYTPDQMQVAFDTLVAQLGDKAVTDAPVADALRDTIIATPVAAGDATQAYNDARAKRFNRFGTAHRGAVKQEG